MTRFEKMKENLKSGGPQIIVSPLLYPTPQPIAARMVELLNPQLNERILEPLRSQFLKIPAGV